MTDPTDPYERHLDDVGQRLRAAAATRSPRRVTRPLAIAGATAAVTAAIVVAVAGSPSGGAVDVLGRAEAALSPRGELLHYVVRGGAVEPDDGLDPRTVGGNPCPTRGDTEVWWTDRPRRWRVRLPADPVGPRCSTLSDRNGRVVRGPQELSWNDGTYETYVPRNDTLDIIAGYDRNTSMRNLPIVAGDLEGGDPVEVVRRLLRDGRVRDTGPQDLNGRAVRVLTGSSITKDPRGTDPTTTRRTVLYVVDAETSEPVRVITTTQLRLGDRARRFRDRSAVTGAEKRRSYKLDFTRFDRRPMDATAGRLLTIAPERTPKITRTTQARLRAQRRIERRENEQRKRAWARRADEARKARD